MSNTEAIILCVWLVSPMILLYIIFRLRRKLSTVTSNLSEVTAGRDLYLQKYMDLELAAREVWSKSEQHDVARSVIAESVEIPEQEILSPIDEGVPPPSVVEDIGKMDTLVSDCSQDERQGPIFFAYIDAKENIDIYTIRTPRYSTVYVSGFCETVSGFRTFRRDRLIKYFDDWHGACEYLSQVIPSSVKPISKQNQKARAVKKTAKKGSLEICFTGFSASEKLTLQKLAMENGMLVRTGIAANLSLLCCGITAGPKKVEEAKGRGVVILDRIQFINFLKTGEVPANEI